MVSDSPLVLVPFPGLNHRNHLRLLRVVDVSPDYGADYPCYQFRHSGEGSAGETGTDLVGSPCISVIRHVSSTFSSTVTNTTLTLLIRMGLYSWNVALKPHSDEHRLERRIADHGLRPNAITAYRAMETFRAHELLRSLLRDPAGFSDHIKL